MNNMTLISNAGVGENLAFLAFPAKRASEQVSATTEELVRNISILIGQSLSEAVSARSRDDFRAARDRHMSRYMQVMIALGDLIGASLDEDTIERLTAESLNEMESDFRHDEQVLGKEIGEQAAFTVWTLRKINDLVRACNAKKVGHHLKDADLEFARQYVGHVLYARFHLDCLRMAMSNHKAIYPEPLEEISNGLRAAVDAYAWVRQGHALRQEDADEAFVDIPWDEEQNQLMHESTAELMRDYY